MTVDHRALIEQLEKLAKEEQRDMERSERRGVQDTRSVPDYWFARGKHEGLLEVIQMLKPDGS